MADNNQPPPPPAAAPPAVAGVMPPANSSHRRRINLIVSLWSLVNALVFCVVLLVAVHTPCRTKQATWVFRCLALTDTSAAELVALVSGGLWCSLAAELSALLHMVLTSCSCWAVDALAWVALAATVGVHCVEVAAGSIGLAAAHPEDDTTLYVDVVLACICLIVDLIAIAGLLLCWCCSRRRRKLLGG